MVPTKLDCHVISQGQTPIETLVFLPSGISGHLSVMEGGRELAVPFSFSGDLEIEHSGSKLNHEFNLPAIVSRLVRLKQLDYQLSNLVHRLSYHSGRY